MGYASCQEDNLDAKSERVKLGKKKVPSMTVEELDDLEELDSGTEVKNTVIIKADGLAINSTEIEDYTFYITFMEDEEQLEPQIDLTATARAEKTGKKVFLISQFDEIKKACALLTALMEAIENQEVVFNVSNAHIKGDEL